MAKLKLPHQMLVSKSIATEKRILEFRKMIHGPDRPWKKYIIHIVAVIVVLSGLVYAGIKYFEADKIDGSVNSNPIGSLPDSTNEQAVDTANVAKQVPVLTDTTDTIAEAKINNIDKQITYFIEQEYVLSEQQLLNKYKDLLKAAKLIPSNKRQIDLITQKISYFQNKINEQNKAQELANIIAERKKKYKIKKDNFFLNGYIIVESNDKFGIVDKEYNLVKPCIYISAQPDGTGSAYIFKKGTGETEIFSNKFIQ